MAREKKEPPPPAGCPAWLATYGDMVTLVLTFFVLLYAMSSVDQAKFSSLAAVLSGNPSIFEEMNFSPGDVSGPAGGSQISPENIEIPEDLSQEEADEWQNFYQALKEYIGENVEGEASVIYSGDTEIILRFPSDILFASGDNALREDAMTIIRKVMDEKLMHEWNSGQFEGIRIEGHADTDPIARGSRWANNMELSTARASSVYVFLLGNYPEINPAVVSTAGYGEYVPIDTNTTSEGKARNRRVELVLLRKTAPAADIAE